MLQLLACGAPSSRDLGVAELPSSCLANPVSSAIGDDYVLVGDMILPTSSIYYRSDLLKYWPEKIDYSDAVSLGTSTSFVSLWQDGILPIEFTSSVPASIRTQILTHCAELSAIADVSCVERTDQVFFVRASTEGAGCFATVGRTIGGIINIDPGSNCDNRTIILHELMHNFGVKHEHQHPDRDNFVRIIEENIRPGTENNFTQVAAGGTITNFDFDSIMIYFSSAFSVDRNTRPTLVRRGPACDAVQGLSGFPNECIIPYNRTMSSGDNAFMAALYGAPGSTPTPPPAPPVNPPPPDDPITPDVPLIPDVPSICPTVDAG